ncbi:MAG: AarF/UbiB family protein [Sumerlaeia bacterium]
MRLSILRPIQVFFALLPFVVSFLRDYRGFLVAGAPRKLTKPQHRRRARKLTDTMGSLGPAFIKGIQVLATREDVLPPEYTDEFKTLQDRVPPFPTKKALAILEEAWGRAPLAVLESFDEEPLAAASLGQVHRAHYRGQEVAVKILRPGVREIVDVDLRTVVRLGRLFQFFVDTPYMESFWSIMAEFRRMIFQEMDFTNEEKHANRLRENFRDEPRVIIPAIFGELTTPQTVVMEFMRGCRVDDPEALEQSHSSAREILDLMIRTYLKMTVIDGFIHADPHPGNLLVDDQGRLVILDYGMALDFGDRIKSELLGGCFALVRGDVESLVDSFYRLKMVSPETNRAVVRDAAEALLEIQLRDDFNPRMIQEVIDDILHTFHSFPLRLPQQLVYLFRASALVEGIGMRYDPHFSSIREAKPILQEMMKDVVLDSRQGWKEQAKDTANTALRTLRYGARVVARLEREELRVRVHGADMDALEGFFRSLLRRGLTGLACLALTIVGAVAAMDVDHWWPLVALVLPGVIGLLLALALPFRRKATWLPWDASEDPFMKMQVERFQERVAKAAREAGFPGDSEDDGAGGKEPGGEKSSS